MSKKYYTLKEVSSLIRTPIPYLRKLIKLKKLKAHFIGRQYVIDENDLITFINTRGIKNDR